VLASTAGFALAMALPDAAPAQSTPANSYNHPKGANTMGTITTKDGTEIYYKPATGGKATK
jgi:hypothetical protein